MHKGMAGLGSWMMAAACWGSFRRGSIDFLQTSSSPRECRQSPKASSLGRGAGDFGSSPDALMSRSQGPGFLQSLAHNVTHRAKKKAALA